MKLMLSKNILFLNGLLGIAALGGTLRAQPTDFAEARKRSEAQLAAVEAGSKLLQNGRLGEAEALLSAANRSRQESAAWYAETAGQLVHVAFALRGAGEIEASLVSAQRALALLGQAEQRLQRSDDRALAAGIKELAGLINERLAGTTEKAKAYYRAAVAIDPASGAAAALSRLEKADEAVTEKQKKNSKG